ncbi:MAG: hypothetical protein JW953_17130 [Anaerolineae bacterium]|nr:hypothetical protein [Anaerolineae bacterium]
MCARPQLPDRRGNLIGQVIVLRNITTLKHAQAELLQQQRAVAMLQERERLARELHDSVGQVLGYVNVQAQTIRAFLSGGKNDDADAQLLRLVHVVQEAQTDVRAYIFGAKTELAPGQGLISALRQYLARFSQNYGIPTALDAPDEAQLFSPVVEAHLFRIIQEALNNVRKHMPARNWRGSV